MPTRGLSKDLAAELQVDFYSGSGNAPQYAAEHKISLETAARDLRHQWFADLIKQGKADKIATAHTLDDQAETVLMRILRGTGTRGLAGIAPAQQDKASGPALTHHQPARRLKRICRQKDNAGVRIRPIWILAIPATAFGIRYCLCLNESSIPQSAKHWPISRMWRRLKRTIGTMSFPCCCQDWFMKGSPAGVDAAPAAMLRAFWRSICPLCRGSL